MFPSFHNRLSQSVTSERPFLHPFSNNFCFPPVTSLTSRLPPRRSHCLALAKKWLLPEFLSNHPPQRGETSWDHDVSIDFERVSCSPRIHVLCGWQLNQRSCPRDCLGSSKAAFTMDFAAASAASSASHWALISLTNFTGVDEAIGKIRILH